MILVIKENTPKSHIDALIARLTWMNLQAVLTEENGRHKIAIVNGADVHTHLQQFSALPDVETILPFTQKFKLAGQELKKHAAESPSKAILSGAKPSPLWLAPVR